MTHIKIPAAGAKIVAGQAVPNNPIIPFIEGDGIGADITPVMKDVIDAAVAKAYGGERKIHWMEVYAGEKATKIYGDNVCLPEETLEALKEYAVSPSAAASARSTSPCAKSSTSTNACARCAISTACPRR